MISKLCANEYFKILKTKFNSKINFFLSAI